MRFSGERQVSAEAAEVWAGLHDHEVLRAIVPGCSHMQPLGDGTYSARLEARVGRLADVYRGTFCVTDVQPGAELRVRVHADGRFGRLQVDLYVTVAPGPVPGTTTLRYDADAVVRGMVSRLGTPALTVAGGHFTSCFFRDLDRRTSGQGRTSRLVPAT